MLFHASKSDRIIRILELFSICLRILALWALPICLMLVYHVVSHNIEFSKKLYVW